MTRDDIIKLAREAGFVVGVSEEHWGDVPYAKLCHPTPNQTGLYSMLENLIRKAAAAEREKVAAWMIERSYATGHGDTIEDLLKELGSQIDERIAAERNRLWTQDHWTEYERAIVAAEREACAKLCEEPGWNAANWCAKQIRARGEKK